MPNIRRPAVAGMFYPSNPNVLKQTIRQYIEQVEETSFNSTPSALLVPHAGYPYSGPVAAYAYKLIENKSFETVLLFGVNHRAAGFYGISVFNGDIYQTPLGDVNIDKDFIRLLKEENRSLDSNIQVHSQEHSVEVQVPFLQEVLKDSFKIVSVLISDYSPSTCRKLGEAAGKIMSDRNALLIISTDLSHYHSYNEGVQMDSQALEYIENYDIESLIEKTKQGKIELCGFGPVIAGMYCCKFLNVEHTAILHYANSGDITGDRSQVVGYASVGFFKE
ncbi:MAG: AmmeMemoRadiSam system protein B [Candidatus Theseobacter exili]|nr:AmmeMemoRadiSam system protein B [Candidatus Theseobacter exili]